MPILAAGQYTQLCVGYYKNGPDWLCCSGPGARPIVDVGPDAAGLAGALALSRGAWLVMPVAAARTRFPTAGAEGTLFPTADEGVLVSPLSASTR